MRTLIFTILFGLLMPLPHSLAAQPAGVNINAMAEESRSAANASLATLGKLVTEKNAPRMGFTTPGEVKQSQLDTPLSVFMVRLDSLQKYQQGDDPMSLLKSTGLIIYPVRLDGSIRSSVTLKKQGTKWRAVSFGSPVRAKALNGARGTVVKRDKRQVSEFFEVRIPAFNLVFVGHVLSGKLMLTPITDVDMYGLKKAATQSAEKIFLRLKPEAERHNGLPR